MLFFLYIIYKFLEYIIFIIFPLIQGYTIVFHNNDFITISAIVSLKKTRMKTIDVDVYYSRMEGACFFG